MLKLVYINKNKIKSEQKVSKKWKKKCRSGGGGGGAAAGGGGGGGVCLAYYKGLVANTACKIQAFVWK